MSAVQDLTSAATFVTILMDHTLVLALKGPSFQVTQRIAQVSQPIYASDDNPLLRYQRVYLKQSWLLWFLFQY